MNPKQLLFLGFIFLGKGILAQSISLRKVTTLPTTVQETSGIESSNPNYIWTHNDSDNEPALYKVDTNGTILRTVVLKNAMNTDWEDVCSDGKHFYIGDIGNNSNNRKDLKIYKIPNPDSSENDEPNPEIISFSYPNQYQFPPSNANLNFDAEALIWFKNNLYIFTKNRTNPFTGLTYLYKIPDVAGQYTATLIDSFKTGDGFKEMWWISAADLSPDGKKLVLLSSDKLFVFTDFTGDNFFKGKAKTIDLGSFTQKEGVAFYTNTEFYITDEYFDFLGGRNLYQGTIKSLYTSGFKENTQSKGVLVSFRQHLGEYSIVLLDETKKVKISILDVLGKEVTKYDLDSTQPIVIVDLPKGYYTLVINDGKQRQDMKVMVE